MFFLIIPPLFSLCWLRLYILSVFINLYSRCVRWVPAGSTSAGSHRLPLNVRRFSPNASRLELGYTKTTDSAGKSHAALVLHKNKGTFYLVGALGVRAPLSLGG